MSEFNVLEESLIPENPKVMDDEYFEVYVPLGGYDFPGMVCFDKKQFFVHKGKVSLQVYAMEEMDAAIVACNNAAENANRYSGFAAQKALDAINSAAVAAKAAEEAKKSVDVRYTISVNRNFITLIGTDGSKSTASFPAAEGIGV